MDVQKQGVQRNKGYAKVMPDLVVVLIMVAMDVGEGLLEQDQAT